ncbi:uncharacterized protein MELLADRAFT_92230 [Melampsora larici-populina 98AG31]|uniref:UDENN domain-containing protein n=1 Tax=Melampsora larici-populina (strain 98AG31 / pathotype 3-4-7) TaxID=747676 RepID=F4R8W6_MELLP|nr:uncharacterized protein MELLADRAFT_92230 [Melampsora larici-populina 98AG31]EGG10882.1 hypothetical protein MELLADRAFT_92230 [Melampsora larici-populina 98AG31]
MASTDQEFDLGQPFHHNHSYTTITPTCSPQKPPIPIIRTPIDSSTSSPSKPSPDSFTSTTQPKMITTSTRSTPYQPSKLQVLLQPPSISSIPSGSTPPLKKTMPIPAAHLTADVLAASRRWFYTFALVNFDLDEGPDFDNCYPPADFSSAQLTNIAFSSFPDCAKTGSLMFSWRIPAINHTSSHPSPATSLANDPTVTTSSQYLSPLSACLTSGELRHQTTSIPSANFDLHGYVYFVQERDPAAPRGYNQRSLVLITHLSDYAGLFSTLISRLGPLYASQGPSVLEAAVHNMARWPDPTAGTVPELPFLGQVHTFAIPLSNQAQLLEPRSQTKSCLHGEILAAPPLTYLSSILFGNQGHMSLSSIWLLWEILILAEPLVVFGSSPDLVSEAVTHLRNLIRPIPFQGDWRPYITIHDPDFPNLFNKSKARTGALIGATNPIILSNTQYWPHVLCLSSKQGTFGLTTERKRHLHKDKSFVKQLDACIERKDSDVLLSRHFALLTEQFLQPLQRYFTTLLPQDTSLSQPRRPSSFNQDVFLKSLKAHATLLEFRFKISTGLSNSVAGFYTKFLRSPNFASWLHSQIDAAAAAVRARYLDRLQSPIELDSWAQGKTQEQIHELLERIESEMVLSNEITTTNPSSPSTHPLDLNSDAGDISHPASPNATAPASIFLSPASISSPASHHSGISPSGPSDIKQLRIERLRAQADRLRNITLRS